MERIIQMKYNEYVFITNNEMQTLTGHVQVITQLSWLTVPHTFCK